MSRPLSNKVLEGEVLLLDDIGGVTAQVVLAPSPKTPGAADLTLMTVRDDKSFAASIDNRGSRYIGPIQGTATALYNNLFTSNETLGLTLASAPEGGKLPEMAMAAASWSQPVGLSGLKLDLNGSVTSTVPGYTLKPFDVRGQARAMSAMLSRFFLRTRAENISVFFKFDWLDSLRGDNLGLGRTVDKLRVLRGGGAWNFSDRFGGSNSISATVSKGIGMFGASKQDDPGLSRADGDPQFAKMACDMGRAQQIRGALSFYTGLTGQKTDDILLASEEFGIGGASYGSAYDSSELTGESGLAGRFELRYDTWPQMGMQQVQYYGFYDLGKVWNPDDAVPSHRQASLADTGVGLRFTLSDVVSGSAEAAVPLTRPVAASNEEKMRFFMSLSASF
jgi:hemolysin activation/secretion protein